METPPDYLAKLNAHERDPYIEFDPVPHVYTVRGEGGYTSVTTWNHTHFSHFDADESVAKIMKSANMQKPTYKYYGMTADEIKASWDKNRDEASSAGTKMHYDIECYWNYHASDVETTQSAEFLRNQDGKPSCLSSNGCPVQNDSVEYQYFMKFVADFEKENPGTKPYRTEWMVYYEELKLSGSIDMIFENPDGTLQIYDWKRSKEIRYDAFGGKTATTECIRHLPDTNFWHYALQLNTYKTILERKYDKKITNLCLVCLHPDNPYKTYDRIPVPFLEKEMADLFEMRRREVESLTEQM
jgi:ATP-dependent exoDNAse (exonuclease V) beta subunit